MHELLKKALEKAGVENVSELHEDEKADYDRYAAVLDKPEIRLEDVEVFCRTQKQLVEDQFGNLDDNPMKQSRLLLLHAMYSKILWFITGTKAERGAAERELTELLKR